MSFLNLLNQLISSVSSCRKEDAFACLGDVSINLLFVLVLAAWFGFLWVLGYAVQDRRSRRLAYVLIAAELLVLGAALLDAKHHTDVLGLLTSLLDIGLAGWTILLAWRLIRAGGGRVTSTRPRRPNAT